MNPRVDAQGNRRENKRAAAKATTALEPHAEGTRPSRKSTRGSANRGKSDTALNLREALEKGSPESRHARVHPKASR